MKKTLKIELKSDLCAGTGKHFASLIDLDTAIDEYGIPFIPAKRLKGCLREIAVNVLGMPENSDVKALFGASGSSEGGALSVTDAKIGGYDDRLDEIKLAIKSGAVVPDNITGLFCTVRAETAIENDTVKNGSLRFIRVVNRTSPLDGEPLEFFAAIEFPDDNLNTVEKLCKGLRNIGYHRNRGFGRVKCTFEEADTEKIDIKGLNTVNDGERYTLFYRVFLHGDLMLPAADANHSLDYIPGTSVLGAFASKYVKKYGENGFNDIFYSNNTVFGNLYISDKDGGEYYPAPRFLAKIKAAKGEQKGIHNQITEPEKDENGNKIQYKPLKKGYINEKLEYKEPDTEIVYHNALNTKESKENKGGLYTQYCVSSGQYYKGFIEAEGSVIKKLGELLAEGSISFGRSKNSQYSKCGVVDAEITKKSAGEKQVNQGIAAYICESDIALMKDGRFTVELKDFCEEINAALGKEIAKVQKGENSEVEEKDKGNLNCFTSLSSRVVSGYNSKWNQKKPQFPVIRAGSAVLFEVKDGLSLPEMLVIGEKRNEGFGRLKLVPDVENMKKAASEDDKEFKLEEASSALLKAVCDQKKNDELTLKAIKFAEGLRFNPSQTGRLTLMCKESADYADFEKRFMSIKTVSVREQAKNAFGIENLKKPENAGSDDWDALKLFIMKSLTVRKYRLRKEGKQE